MNMEVGAFRARGVDVMGERRRDLMGEGRHRHAIVSPVYDSVMAMLDEEVTILCKVNL